ncbi:MAG: hypothetical protein WCH85_09430 [Methanomicrobiales archaeon]
MIHHGHCNEYGPTMINPGRLFSEPRTTGMWRPMEDTMSTDSYREIMPRSTQSTVMQMPESIYGKSMLSEGINGEKMLFGVCEDTSVIHLEPIKKFSFTAKVVSVKKGTIKNIDRTTIEL